MKKAREKRERIVRKKGWAKIGVFIFGLFFGILFTLGSLIGVGFWAYKNLTLQKIEKLTNSTIDIGNDSIKKITIEDIVTNISGITSDKNYTIAKMENDFGITIVGDDGFIPSELYGLDLTPLKNSTLNTLGEDIEDIIGNANINTFLSFLEQSDEELGMFANILNTKIDYFYNQTDNKLYENNELTTPVKFDYQITGNQVTLNSDKNNTYIITNNKISVQFRTVAIESAFGSFDKVTDNLKIYEILDYHYNENDKKYYEDENYTKELTGFMKILATKSISDLSSSTFFDDLKLYEVFGYYYDGTNYYNYYDGTSYSEQVTLKGIEKALAQKSIDDLTSDGAFDDVYIYDVLGLYEYNDEYYEDENHTTKVNGVLNAIAGKTISDLSEDDAFDDVYLYEVLSLYKYNDEYYEDENHTTKVNGVLNSIAEKTLSQLSEEETFNDIYIYEVMNYTREGSEGNYTYKDSNKNLVTGVLGAIAGSTVGNLSTAIDDVKLGEALNLTNPTGVLKALQNTEIKNLETTIQDLRLTQALDLDGTETGVLKALSGSKITELKDDIQDLKIDDALGLDGTETGVLKALSGTPITSLKSKIESLTLGEALSVEKTNAKGAILSFYDTKINELDEALNPANLDIYKAMGYTYENNKYYEIKNGVKTEVTGIMATLAGYKLNKVEDAIDAIKVKDVLPSDSPILALFEENEKESLTIATLSDSVVDKMNNTSVYKLVEVGIITGVEIEDLDDSFKLITIQKLISSAISG